MRAYHRFSVALILLLLASCGPSTFSHKHAAGYYDSSPTQCVPYARQVSGVNLRGDAGTWWRSAAGKYNRGKIPRRNAVLVLKSTSRLPHGHLSVVRTVLGPRVIHVTHSNWGNDFHTRRMVYDFMRAEDVSPHNDWTLVRFWNVGAEGLGRPYPAYGFIYP